MGGLPGSAAPAGAPVASPGVRRRSVVLLALGAVAATAVGAGLYARPLLETGTGYAAHNACAVTSVAGLSLIHI